MEKEIQFINNLLSRIAIMYILQQMTFRQEQGDVFDRPGRMQLVAVVE